MKQFDDFTNLYSLSKTLRFELIPQGETVDNIFKHGLINEDTIRGENYIAVKKIADEYHKQFIDHALANCKLKTVDDNLNDSLFEFSVCYRTNSKDTNFDTIKSKLRESIVKVIKGTEQYKHLAKKEFIEKYLVDFVSSQEEKELIQSFKGFTTYFTGYNTVRANLYDAGGKQGSIAFRLIDQNLPKFIDNCTAFDKINNSPLIDILIDDSLSELLKSKSLPEIFTLFNYNHVLRQCDIDNYNAIVGIINMNVNLYNQQQKEKSSKLDRLKPLFKQILSDRSSLSWLPDSFSSDNEMLETIESAYQEIVNSIIDTKELVSLSILLSSISDYDLSKIYITNDTQLTTISKQVYGDWSVIRNAVREFYIKENPQTTKESLLKFEERIEKYEKSIKQYSIDQIIKAINEYDIDNIEKSDILSYYSSEMVGSRISELREAYKAAEELLNTQYPENKNFLQNEKGIILIKGLVDSLKNFQRYIKPLVSEISEKDESFYSVFTPYWEQLNNILNPLYNMVRNYLTRKPYSTEKIKLNFSNQTLLDGWSQSKEESNTSILLCKDGMYYLGIMNKRHNQIFRTIPSISEGSTIYKKMEYRLLPGANKMLPKVLVSAKDSKLKYNLTDELLDNYNNETHKKGAKFNLQHCHRLINYFKESIAQHPDWSKFNFEFSDTSTYQDLSMFYREVEHQGYKLSFVDIPGEYIDRMVSEGKLYLFQIYNKDFSKYSKGKPNLHTLYWKSLFSEKNLADVVYKLNGQAEVFYRKKSINYRDEVLQNGHHHKELRDKFTYPIIKDKRYTLDKFLFHVPITMNFKSQGINNINSLTNSFIKNNGIKHIIGIDRGERHLLYISVVDLGGNIVEQFSLNDIVNSYNGKEYKTDYRALLKEKENKRTEERLTWMSVENIKELKEGYISQVVNKIVHLIVQYKAIIVMEDLNMGFKQSRQKVDSSVYQKFEKMLIDKFNYIVFKDLASTSVGGVMKAYQLANKFESFQKLGKQSGFIFYVPAWNTSKIDPTTGFVDMLHPRYENIAKTRVFINQIDEIHFDAKSNHFVFSVDYKNYTSKADDTRTKWDICTGGERIEAYRDRENNSQWAYRNVDLTKEFIDLFKTVSIDVNINIKEQINQLPDNKQKVFYERFMYLLRLTLQMRNSNPHEDLDYIVSPVKNSKGNFFNSLNEDETLPKDADANGAYNIALKGLWAIEQIQTAGEGEKLKLAISNKEWLRFIQERNK